MRLSLDTNIEYLLSRPGALKITTIIFGIISSTLCGHSYGESPYTSFYEKAVKKNEDNANLLPGTALELSNVTVTNVFLGLSLFYLVAYTLFYTLEESKINKFIDTVFHMGGCIFLFTGGASLVYSATNIEKTGCHQFQMRPHENEVMDTSSLGILLNVFSRDSWNNRKIPDPYGDFCHFFGEKIVGAIFNMLNGILYGFLAFVVFTAKVDPS